MHGKARTGTIALFCAALAAAAGCEKAGGVALVPIYPDDRPGLLADLDIASLEVRLVPQDAGAGTEPRWVTVERGERLSLALEPGSWKAEIRGVGGGAEVRGETLVFAVEAGVEREVPFFLGEAGAFNLARLEPADVADALAGLSGHTATLYTGPDDRPRILVAGGRRGGELSADAFVVDPVGFTIDRLPSLGCARADHTALLVDVEAGRRVVLAGGVGSCASSMDVYDTVGEAFSLVTVCGVNDARPAVAEVVRLSSELVQTGRVIAPGNPRCVVDLFTGLSEDDVPAVATGPDAPNYAVANSQGQVLVVTPQRIFVDGAEQGSSCIEGGAWIGDATWAGVEERQGGRLIFLGNDQFLFLGGQLPGQEDPDHAWTIVSLKRDCELSRVLEGVRPDDPPPASGFAVIDVGSGTSMALLVAGGRDPAGEPVDRVALLVQPTQAAAPTFHDLSGAARERPVSLAVPRAGAAAVTAPDGNAWLIGGGADARPEIFVGGPAFATTWDRFERRKPTMRMAWILDNGGTAPDEWFDALLPDFRDHVARRIITEFYLGLRTMVLMAANSDRGVDVADLGVGLDDLASAAGCGDTPMPISVVAAGDLEDVELPGSVVEIPEEGQGQSQAGLLDEVDNIIAQLGQDRAGCTWRQFFRRAFDAVQQAGTDDVGAVDLSTGITLVLLAARDDDCSQGVFGGGSFVEIPPSAATLQDHHCTVGSGAAMEEFDGYFGLPPGELSAADLAGIIGELAWDPRDAIFVHLGPAAGGEPGGCSSPRYGDLAPSRRLRETLDWLEGHGSRTAEVDLCGVAGSADLEQRMEEVVALVGGQMPLQACVSLAVAGAPAAYDSDKGEYLPVAPEDAAAVGIADAARELCRALTVVQAGTDDMYAEAIPVDLTACRAGTDSDRRAGCTTDESGWLIRADQLPTVQGTVTENAEFVCLP